VEGLIYWILWVLIYLSAIDWVYMLWRMSDLAGWTGQMGLVKLIYTHVGR
ncbi:hypothetical protein ACJX0J_027239, partial [Zea mays]